MVENEGNADKSGDAGDGKPDPAKPLTMTQAELDALIGRRLATVRAQFSDYDDLKAAKSELDKIREGNASELDKAVTKAKAEGISEATTRANQRLVAAEARAQAAAAGFHNPRDAAKLLDLAGVKVNDDGEADADAIKSLIEEAVRDRPYLIKSDEGKGGGPRPPRHNPGQGGRPGEKPDGREAGRAEAERRFGVKKP
jgi:hypothetical protein